jgi:hypothetical protein
MTSFLRALRVLRGLDILFFYQEGHEEHEEKLFTEKEKKP